MTKDLESVDRQLAGAWYDECLRIQKTLDEVRIEWQSQCTTLCQERDMLRYALLTAQAWMPSPGTEVNGSAIADVKQVYEALGWEYKSVR